MEKGRPNRVLAIFVFVGLLIGIFICEGYGIANGWPKIRRILFFYVTWGFPIGAFGGMAVGFVCYRLFKSYERFRQ